MGRTGRQRLLILLTNTINITIKISGTNGNNIFRYTEYTNEGCFPPPNFKIDLSECTSIASWFQGSKITHIGELDLRNVGTATNAFSRCENLKIIDKLIFSDTKSPTINSAVFQLCSELEEIRIEGAISNTFYIGQSEKLSRDSILSILKALKLSGVSPTITLPTSSQNLVTGDNVDAELNAEYIRATTELTYNIVFE